MKRVAASLRVKLNSLVTESVLAGVTFGSSAHSMGLPALGASIVGLATPTLVAAAVETFMPPTVPEHLTDYSYLYSAGSHLDS